MDGYLERKKAAKAFTERMEYLGEGNDYGRYRAFCKAHEKELMDAIKSGNAMMVLRSWARAQVDQQG